MTVEISNASFENVNIDAQAGDGFSLSSCAISHTNPIGQMKINAHGAKNVNIRDNAIFNAREIDMDISRTENSRISNNHILFGNTTGKARKFRLVVPKFFQTIWNVIIKFIL